MNKVYDFNWMIDDIDNSIVFALRKDNMTVANYNVMSVISGDYSDVSVKFANINDLNKFINYAFVRFVDISNDKNIIDIPVRTLHVLFENANDLEMPQNKTVKLPKLEALAVYEGENISKDYEVMIYKVNEISHDLDRVVEIAGKFSELGMYDMINAFEEINMINYQRDKNNGIKKA